jgi:hypothetical protein
MALFTDITYYVHFFQTLKVLSSVNQGGLKVASIDRYCFSIRVLDIFLDLKGHHLGFCKKWFVATCAQIIDNV